MRQSRIYCPKLYSLGECITLDEKNAHYLLHVLRVKQGSVLNLFDGCGIECEAEIFEVGRKQVIVLVKEFVNANKSLESPLHTTLAIAVSKGERMDWVMQKATELGVTLIQPLLTQRVDVKLNQQRLLKKCQHWQGIIVGACEQSGRNVLPELLRPANIIDWLDTASAEVKLVLHTNGKSFTEISSGFSTAPQTAMVLIGPEGGLNQDEINKAEQTGFLSTGFGQRVLRTETAPIVALSLLQAAWGDF